MTATENTTTQAQSNTDREDLETRVLEFISSAPIPEADKFLAAAMNAFIARRAAARRGKVGGDREGVQ